MNSEKQADGPGTLPPVIGFVLFGGPLSGGLIRDIRLANELACRGYPVHAWWVMDRPRKSPLDEKVQQHWLFHGLRYLPAGVVGRRGRGVKESLGRFASWRFSDGKRARSLQKRPEWLARLMGGFMAHVCDGVENDRRVIRRFARQLTEARVTHMLPMLSVLCPWVMAARSQVPHRIRYAVTFQGYELYVNYARAIGREQEIYARLLQAVEQADYPAIAVSADYAQRVCDDIGTEASSIRAIPPGVPTKPTCERARASEMVQGKFPAFRPDVPLVTFFGRRDAEKGIDLLLYAASILRRRGVDLQLAICGPTLFGDHNATVCRQIAQDLGFPIMWSKRVSDEMRSALFFASRCVVYPSIHREPFGMVPVEALAHGTPVVVPDIGGVAGAIQARGESGGLHFRAWDSGDLADQIARLLEDQALWDELSARGPRVADYYSVPRLADRVLDHIGLPPKP